MPNNSSKDWLAFLDNRWFVLNNCINASFADFTATIKFEHGSWEAKVSRGSGYPDSLPFVSAYLGEAIDYVQSLSRLVHWSMIEEKLKQDHLLSPEQLPYCENKD